MWESEPRPLPDWIRRGYDVLAARVERQREDLSRDDAYELLLEHEDVASDPADAKYVVRVLLERGWLYEVDDDLRITDPEHGP